MEWFTLSINWFSAHVGIISFIIAVLALIGTIVNHFRIIDLGYAEQRNSFWRRKF